MTREKQTEEMVRDIKPLLNGYIINTTGECWNGDPEDVEKVATRILEKGYRKERHGRWRGWHGDKMVAEDVYRHYHYNTCSECGKGSAIASEYCPNCGALMDGEGEAHERDVR